MEKILGRDDLLSSNLKLVSIPEMGGSAYIRSLSTAGLFEFREKAKELGLSDVDLSGLDDINAITLMALIGCLTICDQNGDLLFTPDDTKLVVDRFKLSALLTLSTQAMALSGLDINLDEVAANLKKVQTTSSYQNSVRNSRKRKRK